MSEKKIMHQCMVALTNAGSRMFRNQVGLAFQGKPERTTTRRQVWIEPGDIVIRKARTVKAGLITGSADLIGWTSRMITEHDLGKLIAQFTACEVKDEGKLEPEQLNFLQVVRDSGGVAIVARSAEEAVDRLHHGGPLE